MIAETAAWAADQGRSLFDILMEIYARFGFYKESLLSVTRKGKTGAEEIQQMMVGFRNNPPAEINGSPVVRIMDYLSLQDSDLVKGSTALIDLPKSNVLQFYLTDGSIISVRPSGTEPKIKFYFGVREPFQGIERYEETLARLNQKIDGIIKSMNLA